MFRRHLNWTLLVGAYFVSAILAAFGFIVGVVISNSTGLNSKMLAPILCLTLSLACYALVSAWYLKNKGRSYWHLLWLLPAALLLVLLATEGRIVLTLAQPQVDWRLVARIVNTFLFYLYGWILLAFLILLLFLKDMSREPTIVKMKCPEHPDRMTAEICSDCTRSVCKECKRTIGSKIFCYNCFEARHLTPVELNWFQKHINWTYGILTILAGTFMLEALVQKPPGAWSLQLTILIAVLVVIVIAAGIWVLWMKQRSLWFTAAALWPFIPGLALFAWITKDAARYDEYSQLVLILAALTIVIRTVIAGTIINAVVLIILRNNGYVSKGKIVKKWYRIIPHPGPLPQGEGDIFF